MVKTQNVSSKRAVKQKANRKIGSSIARKKSPAKELEPGMNSSSVHPIDTLLVQQIENLLHGEAALRARYSTIDSSDNIEVRMAFRQELAELKERADRLYRLVDAMDFYGPYGSQGAGLSLAIA